MATNDRGARLPPEYSDVIVFRCQGCAVRFPGDAGGPGCCPRCGAIGGHERLGRSATGSRQPSPAGDGNR